MTDFVLFTVAVSLVAYTIYLRNLLDLYRTDFNDIFDRIRFWRKGGCSDERSFWLLSDIAGIISRRQGYFNVQRPVSQEAADESAD